MPSARNSLAIPPMSLSLNLILAARLALPLEFPVEGDTATLDTAEVDVAAMIEQYQDSAAAGFTYDNGTVQLAGLFGQVFHPAVMRF